MHIKIFRVDIVSYFSQTKESPQPIFYANKREVSVSVRLTPPPHPIYDDTDSGYY